MLGDTYYNYHKILMLIVHLEVLKLEQNNAMYNSLCNLFPQLK